MPSPLHVLVDGVPLLALLPSAFFPVVFVVLIALVVLILWIIWTRPLPASRTMDAEHLPGGPSAISRPILTKTEATLLNLIRLAVQDTYLVLAKLPVTSVVSLTEEEEETRKTILRAIRAVRLDVALVHPGTLCSVKVIQFVEEEAPSTQAKDRERVVESVLQAAGIDMIRLELHTTYTVAKLVELLGLGEVE